MLKLEKSQYLNSILQLNFTKYEKKVMLQICLLQEDLKDWMEKCFHKIYIFLFDLKKHTWKSKIQFSNHDIWNVKKP